jgi:hypothetical protein
LSLFASAVSDRQLALGALAALRRGQVGLIELIADDESDVDCMPVPPSRW